MVAFGRAGLRDLQAHTGFAPATGPAAGNDLPSGTGAWDPARTPGGPGPHATGGQLGAFDGSTGPDPRAAKIQPFPHRWVPPVEGGTGQGRRNYLAGISGFNDRLTVRDRHAYFDRGTMRTGVTPSVPGNPPNPVTDGPARPDLRAINRSLSFQVGSDNTRNQDDLSRPYTGLGEQGTGWSPVYGGQPGLYQPYGTRGGVPFPIVAPVGEADPGAGPQKVFSGPPHGLHSLTIGGRWQTIQRYATTTQMRPVRADRPSNSPQAGQSYSQTVQHQGGPTRAAGAQHSTAGIGLNLRAGGRGWAGQK